MAKKLMMKRSTLSCRTIEKPCFRSSKVCLKVTRPSVLGLRSVRMEKISRAEIRYDTPSTINAMDKSVAAMIKPAAAGPGLIVFGTTRGFLYCLNDDGSQRWIYNTGSVIGASPLICNGIVYFGTLSKQLIGVDADRGNERWRFQTRGRVRTAPLIWNDMLFVASEDRYVYGFSAAH